MTPAARFDEHLQSLGIPIHGVRPVGDTFEITFKDEATAQQRSQGQAAIATFDFSEKHPRQRNAVMQDIANLSPAQREALLRMVMAEFLLEHPRIAKLVSIAVEE